MKLLKIKTKRNTWLNVNPTPHWSKEIKYTVELNQREFDLFMRAIKEDCMIKIMGNHLMVMNKERENEDKPGNAIPQ